MFGNATLTAKSRGEFAVVHVDKSTVGLDGLDHPTFVKLYIEQDIEGNCGDGEMA